MARNNFREIILMILAVIGGLGILLVIGSRLIQLAFGRATAGTAGIAAVTGGVSIPLFSVVLVVALAIVALAVFLWKR